MNAQPLICAFCPTYNRPHLLGRMIKCFERQTYENRFLIIVDDAGQYENQKGDRWELISIPRRVLSLGEKNNLAISLAPRETWGLAKMDDDDFYMPWHLEAIAEALTRGPLVQPRLVIDFWHGHWVIVESFGRRKQRVNSKCRTYKSIPTNTFCYHGSWGYTRELFANAGGYGCCYAGDDCEFQHRLVNIHRITSVDVDNKKYRPSYIYNRPLQNRISELGSTGDVYWNKGNEEIQFVGEVPKWTDESIWDIEIPTEVIQRPW